MLPILLIYRIICEYVFLKCCNKMKNTLPDVILGLLKFFTKHYVML